MILKFLLEKVFSKIFSLSIKPKFGDQHTLLLSSNQSEMYQPIVLLKRLFEWNYAMDRERLNAQGNLTQPYFLRNIARIM